MKKQRLGVLLFLALFFLLPSITSAQTSNEQIEKFKVDITINKDSSVNVVETITYDFGDNERHGIFRFVPKTYFKDDLKYRTVITDFSVEDFDGKAINAEFSSFGDKFEVKIGDRDVLISGVHTYSIKYKVDGAIGYFSDRDELYWNLTGNEWNVPIKNVESSVSISNFSGQEKLFFSCYSGKYGSSNDCSNSATTTVTDNGVTLTSIRELSQGEGITIAIGFPKGIVFEPTWIKKNTTLLISLGIDGLLLILLAYIIGRFWYVWSKEGKDPKGRSVIVPEYDVPDNLSPLEVSAILNQRIKTSDISSEIIHLAVLGYLIIKQSEKKILGFNAGAEYSLIRTDKTSVGIPEYDRLLLKNIFIGDDTFGKEVKLDDLKDEFYTIIDSIKIAVSKDVFEKGYYTKNNNDVLNTKFFGSLVFISAFALFSIIFSTFLTFWGIVHASVAFIAAQFIWIPLVIIAIAYFVMPKKTDKGIETKEKIEGLEMYLRIAEKNRLEFHNAPEKKPEIFEKLLPFAMTLGVAEIWAKEFADIYKTPPNWYQGYNNFAHANFASDFVREINSFSTTSNSTLSSHPSSSGSGFSASGGGGFSGGGGGGGGGLSW